MNAETTTAIGAINDTAGRLISSLPAQFLVLVLLNCGFVMGLLWFLNNSEDRRERIFGPVLTACLQQISPDVLHQFLQGQQQQQMQQQRKE
jgi:hypothetical protein